ncbi:protein of unknown function [Streptantibioticus cattleyicolor NRRL 8057 = DSM 46488]|nr:protein of unknown function [Streptantibioticus cattleyicolor NRRL 8057 = DSM 46488]
MEPCEHPIGPAPPRTRMVPDAPGTGLDLTRYQPTALFVFGAESAMMSFNARPVRDAGSYPFARACARM